MNIYLKKPILLLALALLPCLGLHADYKFKSLDSRDGLTSSQVNCILKDSRGFVWFGTPAGMYRYDGYRFRHFQCDSQDGTSLPDSYIESIQEALGGNLWVKTAAGYCIYDPQTEAFERDMHTVFSRLGYKDVPKTIYIDRFCNLWGVVSGQGVLCYNMQLQLQYFFAFTDDARGLPSGNVCSISECRDGTLLVYDDGRLVCCKVGNEEEVLWRNDYIARQHLRKTNTLRAFADQQDNIWLYGQGTLFVYNKRSRTWNTQVGDDLNLTGTGVDNAVNAMGGDPQGNVWIGTSRHGLVRMNVMSLEKERVQMNTMNKLSRLSTTTAIRSIYIDNSSLLWVGTAKAGVAYYGENIYKFEAEMLGDITAICQDSTGAFWYGTSENGILGYGGPLASVKVSALAATGDGSIWVGSPQNGLTRIRSNGQTTFYSTANDSIHHSLIDNHINAMTCDNQGNLWIASDGGLQIYNTRMNQFSNYTKELGKIRTNNITSLFYSSGNRMIIGTSEGLIIMNVSTGEMTHYTGNSTSVSKFTNNYITQVFEDSRGLVWVGTREGVNILNPESDVLDHITERSHHLCNNNICGIAEDHNRNIWLTTSNGATRVVVQRNHEDGTYQYGLYNYTIRDGLQSDEFNPGAIVAVKDGRVLMGGLNGVSWVRPKTSDEREALPPVILTELYIGEEEILVGHSYDGTVPLPLALNEINRISLGSSQNTFTIKFAAGSYNQSERLQFMYMLEGSDDETWHNGDALTHSVTFTNLTPGKYLLHVKASSTEADNSDKERVLEIVVARPIYLQYWMLIIYALIIAVIIYMWKQGIDHLRSLWHRKKAVIGELVKQREEIKSASEEIKQPMSRMATIITDLAMKETSLEEREQLNSLHAQMLTLITRLTDMQSNLENPEQKARQAVRRHYLMEGQGEMNLPDVVGEELTPEIKPIDGELPTARFRVIFIDSSDELVKFVSSRLKYLYDFHPYNDIHKAAADIEAMMPDLVVCKQDMRGMTGSELCKNIKLHPRLNRIKFVLMTDSRLSAKDMLDQGIAMSADDYLPKPFNLQEAIMRFNKLLGVGPIEIDSRLIEGAATRMLEDRNSSMTTASESNPSALATASYTVVEDEQIKAVTIAPVKTHGSEAIGQNFTFADDGEMIERFSMADSIDRQLLNSIEQYVQQNMSRGTINLEEMAQAMGMAMKPFFQKVRDITGKTPAEVVRDIRLRHACILLQRTDLNMSVLANNVGFATGEHFIALFKERFGMSPSEYRLRYRKKS